MWTSRVDFVMSRSGRGTGLGREESGVSAIRRFLKDESGATAIEYGLIAALIAVAVIGGVSAVGGSANQTFTTISTSLDNAS